MSDLRDHMKNFLCDKLFNWAFGNDEDDLNKALLQASDEKNHALCNNSIFGSGSILSSIYNKFHPQPNLLFLTLQLPVPAPYTSSTHSRILP